jgi:ornithine decarboxylase
MEHYSTALDLVRKQSPDFPVAIVRRGSVAIAAQWFQAHFKGQSFYAVKANPQPWVIHTLWESGLKQFDVASLAEIELVRGLYPQAELAFMHPVKSRHAIYEAYFTHGVRTFSLDTHEELNKILDVTHKAKDLNLIVRLAVETNGAAMPLRHKFGIGLNEAPDLLIAARGATSALMGISFHVGSQCMSPGAYVLAMQQASRALVKAGVFADVVDIGGGFPSHYPGMEPPPLIDYMNAIHDAFEQMMVHESTELWAEPGRVLVAESTSVLTKVELRKDNHLYLNDGAYGMLFDAAHARWLYPTRTIKAEGMVDDRAQSAFDFYGPTCDSIDYMPGPFYLPSDIHSGDYIEIGALGAYGSAMRTGFNGFGTMVEVTVDEAPLVTQFQMTSMAATKETGLKIRRAQR